MFAVTIITWPSVDIALCSWTN